MSQAVQAELLSTAVLLVRILRAQLVANGAPTEASTAQVSEANEATDSFLDAAILAGVES